MSKYLKNNTESSMVVEGYTIAASSYQLIDPIDYHKIGESSDVLGFLATADLIASEDNSGNTDITDLNQAVNFLKNLLAQEVRVEESKWYKDAWGFRARWKGFSGVASGGTTTDLDFQIASDRYINGLGIILKGANTGDKASLQVVDVDGVYFTEGTVLDTFVEDWFFSGDSERQCDSVVEYPAKISAGLYLRVKYTSTGESDVTVYCNTKLHQIPE